MSFNLMARFWLILACSCLLISGLLALVITAAKAPAIRDLVVNIELIRWCLVIHVNLASLVWFTAIPVVLVQLTKPRTQPSTGDYLGALLAVTGVLLMFSVLPIPGLQIVLSNYTPILAHPRYYMALSLYVIGVLVSLISASPLLYKKEKPYGLSEIGFGSVMGTAIFILAVITTVLAYLKLSQLPLMSQSGLFELGMWGGGHLLQHFSALFMVSAWVILLGSQLKSSPFTRKELFPIYAYLSVPVFITPLILNESVLSGEYRMAFTKMMQWGIAPAVIVFIIWSLKRFGKRILDIKSYESTAFMLSALLIFLGFLFGSLIRGSDMRIPGHYHASIGAVTLSFMAAAYYLLSKGAQQSRWILASVWTYGIGQTFFATGMFVAGSFGLGRKTYGSQHTFENLGQTLGFGTMAIGGLIAFAGGLLFAISLLPYLKVRLLQKTEAIASINTHTLRPTGAERDHT